MPFDPGAIYRRTPAGVRELYAKSTALAPEARLALRLIDGRIAAEGLRTRLPAASPEQIGYWIEALIAARLVEWAGRAPDIELAPAGEGAGLSAERRGVVAALERAADESGATQAVLAPAPAAPRHRVARPAPGADGAQSTVVTQFAITSVNVPDALDLQEERDRAEWSEALARSRRSRWRRWGLRGGVAAAVLLSLALTLGWWRPMPDSLGAAALGQQLSVLMEMPVAVGASTVEFAPAPRLVLKDVVLAGGARAGRVEVRVGWGEIWRGLAQGQWSWGEARVSAVSASPAQALAIAHALLARGEGLPERISALRFETVRVSDSRLLAGDFEVMARRGADGRFGRLMIRRIDHPQGRWEATVSGATPHAPLVFELEASELALPFGPRLKWNELRASGTVSANAVRVSHFALAGYHGVVTGGVLARRSEDWSITGEAELANLDIEALVAGRGASASGLQGVANARLDIEGQGATLATAVDATRVAGEFQVRWAVLRGVNLGAFAVQSAGLGGGATRFTEFDGRVLADRYGIRLAGVGGRAGAMLARGDVQIAPDGALRGRVRVELGGLVVHAPVTLAVDGNLQQPQFAPAGD